MTSSPPPNFEQLGLNASLLKALKDVGYESPSPIQAESIPPLLAGRDILGQAQTGTGKTAAFALPILQQVDLKQRHPQVLVLAPTRELAIQVAEAFQRYAHYLKDFHVLPIYGGQGYENQIRALKRGVHVVVGTPGRVMDHMRKGTLVLDNLKHLVLDEADEMLRMGFIDDVEWVMSQIPEERQIALFSATMPREIAKVANTYLRDPVNVKIQVATKTADTIYQRYWPVAGLHKLDALTRILEAESFDAMIIFVRTKTATVELAEKLEARGYNTAALNGDITQVLRERTVERLKSGRIDILVATDVAARGLDVERISHVLNYDIPYDTEAYIHRIGRTGRAGRKGDAILFVARREMRMLSLIEKATGQPIEPMKLPTAKDINQKRVERFKTKLQDAVAGGELEPYRALINEFVQETDGDLLDIAAALARLAQGEQALFLNEKAERPAPVEREEEREYSPSRERRRERDQEHAKKKAERGEKPRRERSDQPNVDMETYRIEVGRKDNVTPSNIVGAIANEADIDSQYIGHIKIHDDYCTVDLPSGMPKELQKRLRKTWVCGKQLNLALLNAPVEKAAQDKPFKDKPFKDRPVKDKPLKEKAFNDKPAKAKGFKEKAFKEKPPRERQRDDGPRGGERSIKKRPKQY